MALINCQECGKEVSAKAELECGGDKDATISRTHDGPAEKKNPSLSESGRAASPRCGSLLPIGIGLP